MTPQRSVGPLLATLLVILQLGYSYGEPSHIIFLPWIVHLIDPSLLANDWFVNTIPHHLNSIRFMAWLGRFVPVPAALLVLHVVALFLLVWAAHRIVIHLLGDWRVFYVALFLALRWGADGLGGNGLLGNYLVQHNAAVAVCLAAFYLVLRNKPVAAAALCAAATWIHIQLGALTMLVLGVGMAIEWRRTGLRSILLAAGVYLAAVAPTVLQQWMLYMRGPSPLSPWEYLYIHAIMRHPHHLIPSSWFGSEFYRFFLVAGIAALAGDWRREPHRTILIWFLIIMALCVIGTVFVEIVPVKLIIKLQLFRMTVFVKFFALVYAARFLLTVLEDGGLPQKVCVLAMLTVPNFSVVGTCAALIFALRQKRLWLWAAGLFAAGCITGLSTAATAALGLPIPMFWHSFAVPSRGLWMALASMAALSAVALPWGARFTRCLPAVLIVFLVAARAMTGLPYFGYDHPPADEWYQFCRRIKTQTPRDAVFITPPFLGGFQLFAERAEVANFKCVPLIETDLVEWKRRLGALSGTTDLRCSGWVDCGGRLAGGYFRLRDHDFVQLGRKYGAQYVVTSQPEQKLNLPEVLRVGDYVLYRLP